ncbi:MAG TPA: hypothetical protein P5278_00780 [Patescibacteria group bacterium]|nr:hypothetical protein [Patescibacteria group bacterium]
MPKKVKKILIALVTILIVTLAVLIASPKQYLIIDGQNNIAYGGAINTVFWEGLDNVSYETAHLANAYLEDQTIDYIVLINPPSAKTVLDFYKLATAHGAKLIIGDTLNEKKLKSELFDLNLSNKQVRFQTNQEWRPDWKNSFY